ncbi:MAG TPA: LPS assembly protein LptD [Thermoanaerobaculia bacterium]|nr:LPS assembly protein LptD [Thermoanaerobaculia bacterium]
MTAFAHLLLFAALALPPELLEAPVDLGRSTFVLPLPEEKGGGEVSGSAGDLEYQREDYALLSGGVTLRYQDMTISAEEVALDLATQDVTAVGNVVVDQGPNRLTGSTARFNLDTKTGVVRDASAAVAQGIYFSGDEIAKIGDTTYTIDEGIFTSCEGEVPPWSFHVDRATVELEDYAFIHHAAIRVKGVPVLYVPYLVWPTKTERSSGLLVPNVGNSEDRGSYLGLAYYQVLGRSWDTTLLADLWTNDYYGVGSELRYHPSEGTLGGFKGYAIDDPLRDEWRWKVRWDHVTRDLPAGLRGVVSFEDYSDFDFFRDFERNLNAKAKASIYSTAYLSGNWGSQSFNLMADRRQTFVGGGRIVEQRQLPELEYELRPTRLGRTPLYLALSSGAHYLSIDRGGFYDGDYGRIHLFPNLRVPLSPTPWLSLSVSGGSRFTWYGDSLGTVTGDDGASGTGFVGESLSRLVPIGGLEMVGPSFSRIFDGQVGPFGRWKHLVEPRLQWSYVGEYDDQQQVPVFDEVDPLGPQNLVRVSLFNRLLAKPVADEEEGLGGGAAREVVSLEIARSYSFDEEQALEIGGVLDPASDELVTRRSRSGPLEAVLRIYPTDRFSLRLDADYSLLFEQLTSTRITGSVALWAANRLDFAWSPRWQATTGEILSNQGSLGWRLDLLPGRLSLASALSYDFERDLLRDQRHFITWLGSCYALRLELHESQTVTQRRRDYLFSVDLKNVGTFLDLTGGESEGF